MRGMLEMLGMLLNGTFNKHHPFSERSKNADLSKHCTVGKIARKRSVQLMLPKTGEESP